MPAFSTWNVVHQPAAATQATITKAAGGANVRHVVTGFTVSIAAAGTAQTPVLVELLDNATQIWCAQLAAPINSSQYISRENLAIPITANTAVTLRFAAAGVAASLEAVTLHGYSLGSS